MRYVDFPIEHEEWRQDISIWSQTQQTLSNNKDCYKCQMLAELISTMQKSALDLQKH